MSRPESAGVAEGHAYAEQVLAGDIVACHWVKRACERYMHDLEHAPARGFTFDRELAEHYLSFPPNMLRLQDGKWAGKPFNLEPFQAFIDMNVYGWVKTGTQIRRFRTSYEEMARKNGKSPKMACNAIQGLVVDEEPGAQVYTAATKREQAAIVLKYAQDMWRDPRSDLSMYGRVTKPNIITHDWTDPETGEHRAGGFMRALSKDGKSIDGFNPNFSVVDELHAHKTPEILDVLSSSQGARENWLLRIITTAGYVLDGVCVEQRDYVKAILNDFDNPDGFHDDTYFGAIYTLDGYDGKVEDDEKDDPLDPEVWIKANPGLGVIKSVESMETMAKQAKRQPRKMAEFLTKHCCIWVSSSQHWVNMQHWKQCSVTPVTLDDLKGRTVWAGLDLASVRDVNALVLIAESETDPEGLDVFCRFYVPEAVLQSEDSDKKASMYYPLWAEQGWLTTTPGEVTNYNFIKADLIGPDSVANYDDEDRDEHAERGGLEGIANVCDLAALSVDRWNASQLVTDLAEEGVNVVGFGQGWSSMDSPLKHIERCITARKLNHGNNPVLNWMASNMLVKVDESDNIRPDKKNAQAKIDGMVALANAVGVYLLDDDSSGGTDSGIVIAGAA